MAYLLIFTQIYACTTIYICDKAIMLTLSDLRVTVSLSETSVRSQEGGPGTQLDREDIKKRMDEKFLSLVMCKIDKLTEKSR